MAKYQCNHCNKLFLHAAKATDYSFNNINIDDFHQSAPRNFMHPNDFMVTSQIESSVCPYCRSLEFEEVNETVANVESVYIYELTSGPQTALDGLLAQGYQIVNRYAKAYHLEKPKAAPTTSPLESPFKNPDPDSAEAAQDNTPENTEAWKQAQEKKQP